MKENTDTEANRDTPTNQVNMNPTGQAQQTLRNSITSNLLGAYSGSRKSAETYMNLRDRSKIKKPARFRDQNSV